MKVCMNSVHIHVHVHVLVNVCAYTNLKPVICTCTCTGTMYVHLHVHQVVRQGFIWGGGGAGGPSDHKCPPLEFEKAKLLDMSNTCLKQV